ncbi:ABC transporter ATP-binding protein [Brachybacterium sp. EF45031]|uniref:ABC transporter ATP-binding protein n=1 Tax=Brachybacterium sillae TaxID=2810536 RepID=UPI00217EB5F0|nr:ABC transporter ATP-binding protein [Brachybacterium sillae]MCS6712509.1 ABC transporter ATP-binding protein [Brachybacterium sillae]
MSVQLDRELDEILSADATAQRQLDQHAALLPIADGRTTSHHLLGELRRRWLHAVATVLTMAASAACTAMLPRLIGRSVDTVVAGGSARELWMIAVWTVVYGVLGAALGALGFALVSALGQRILAGMREEVIDRALDLPAQTLERSGIGDALSRVADDVDVTARAVNNIVPFLVQTVIMVVVTLASMILLSPWLLLVLVPVLPMYAVAGRWYLRRTGPIYRTERVAMGARAQGLLSAIHGTPTVHAYGIERRETEHVAVLSQAAAALGWRVMRLVVRVCLILAIPENLALVLVLLAGYLLVNVADQPVGTAAAAGVYLLSLMWPMLMVIFSLDDVQSAAASLTRMVGVIRSIPTATSPGSLVPVDGSLRLEGVSHAYGTRADGSEHVVLQPLDLHVPEGSTLALVGASGAGKSTLASILAGTLTPRHGRVLHGGADLTRGDLEALRANASIVNQDVHVFRGTLAEDLRLARPDATEDELLAALDLVGARGWAQRLPKGLETEVGEKGERLTAEQSQQLALARIALQDPRVLVLDEATADEGSAGARTLERAALAVSAGRTTVIVAHRLSQARQADRILVMEQGRVVEDGSHEELVARGGSYARLWSAWEG